MVKKLKGLDLMLQLPYREPATLVHPMLSQIKMSIRKIPP